MKICILELRLEENCCSQLCFVRIRSNKVTPQPHSERKNRKSVQEVGNGAAIPARNSSMCHSIWGKTQAESVFQNTAQNTLQGLFSLSCEVSFSCRFSVCDLRIRDYWCTLNFQSQLLQLFHFPSATTGNTQIFAVFSLTVGSHFPQH